MQSAVGFLIGPIHLTANLPRNLTVKKIVNRLKFDRIMVMSLWPGFWPTLYIDRGPHTSQPINQLFLRKNLPYYMHSVLSIPDVDPLIQCQLTELSTWRAWASSQTELYCMTLLTSLFINRWNTLSIFSSATTGSVELRALQNSLA